MEKHLFPTCMQFVQISKVPTEFPPWLYLATLILLESSKARYNFVSDQFQVTMQQGMIGGGQIHEGMRFGRFCGVWFHF